MRVHPCGNAKLAGTADPGSGQVLVHQAQGVLLASQPPRLLREARAEVSRREQAQRDLGHAGLAGLRALKAQCGEFRGALVPRVLLQP
jgi:hypothetical protein